MGNQKVLEEKLDPNYEPTPEGESKNVPLSYELNPCVILFSSCHVSRGPGIRGMAGHGFRRREGVTFKQ